MSSPDRSLNSKKDCGIGLLMAFVSNTVQVHLHSEEQISIQDHHNKLFHLEASIPALAPTEPIYNTANCHIQSSTSQQKLNKFSLKKSMFSF